jgi:hydroxypyruvate isomerase
MLVFSANLTLLFNEVSFLDRFRKAAEAGFRAVEFQFPYAHRIDDIADRLDRYGLEPVLHNLPAGDWSGGERGIACLPDRAGEFQDSVGLALEYAGALGCRRLNCLAGVAPEGEPHDRLRETLVENLRFGARSLAEAGIALLIEPLNTRDTPGFFLCTASQAADIIRDAGCDNLHLQFDVYHMHIMGGDVAASLAKNLAQVAHVQIADAPGRHQPGTGEINYEAVFQVLEDGAYRHWVGCEYVPLGTTEESLVWLEGASKRS